MTPSAKDDKFALSTDHAPPVSQLGVKESVFVPSETLTLTLPSPSVHPPDNG